MSITKWTYWGSEFFFDDNINCSINKIEAYKYVAIFMKIFWNDTKSKQLLCKISNVVFLQHLHFFHQLKKYKMDVVQFFGLQNNNLITIPRYPNTHIIVATKEDIQIFALCKEAIGCLMDVGWHSHNQT